MVYGIIRFALVSQCFFTRWLSFKLQLCVSSASLQVGCEPLVPLGLQKVERKSYIQVVLVYYSQDLNLCRHRDNFRTTY